LIVRVLYFASLQDLTGTREDTLEVPPSFDVEALWREVSRYHPRLREVAVRPLVACDMAYATWDRTLDDVVEVAFLPPVSGG